MSKLTELKKHLKRGGIYRRSDLEQWSNAVDRHLLALVKDGTLQKLSQGLYYYPKESAFGTTPPEEEALVRGFLKDDYFLLTSPNAYNSLGVGTTQLYNKRLVYNHKRHGEFLLGGKRFTFLTKPRFPKNVTEEFLVVDLLNNIEKIAEDPETVLKNVAVKIKTMDAKKLVRSVTDYGTIKAKKFLAQLFKQMKVEDGS
jgi:Family of unknown function (DUF6088)